MISADAGAGVSGDDATHVKLLFTIAHINRGTRDAMSQVRPGLLRVHINGVSTWEEMLQHMNRVWPLVTISVEVSGADFSAGAQRVLAVISVASVVQAATFEGIREVEGGPEFLGEWLMANKTLAKLKYALPSQTPFKRGTKHCQTHAQHTAQHTRARARMRAQDVYSIVYEERR